jgi:cell wall-associated NlpC family hydrolase
MEYFVNFESVVPMRREPNERAEMVSQLLFGEYGLILDKKDSFILVENSFDKYQGWVDAKMVTAIHQEEHNQMVDSSLYRTKLPVTDIFDTVNKSIVRLSAGSVLPNYDRSSGRFGLGDSFQYRIHPSMVSHIETYHPSAIISFARLFLNTPYLWGGKNVFGMDCSGFVQVIFSLCGFQLPRDASQQIHIGEVVETLSEGQAGDLAFFEKNGKITHVGILVSPEQIIHASGKVKIDKIDSTGITSTLTGEYTHQIYSIKRII